MQWRCEEETSQFARLLLRLTTMWTQEVLISVPFSIQLSRDVMQAIKNNDFGNFSPHYRAEEILEFRMKSF